MAPDHPDVDVGRLLCVANDIDAATADWFTRAELAPLSDYLADVRRSLGMDVAFVSEFLHGRRQFNVVSVSARSEAAIEVGGSDALVETYCKLVADGALPAVIRDVDEHPQAAALAVTRQLRIKSYLSALIVLPDGSIYGTLCCFTHEPRKDLRDEHAAALRKVADALAARIAANGGSARAERA